MLGTYKPGRVKRCTECGEVKDHREYNRQKHKNGRVYIKSRCKVCEAKHRQKYDRAHDDVHKAQMRARGRAVSRLKAAAPDLYELFYREELAKEGL